MKKQKILVIANGIFGKNPGLSGGDVRFLEIVRNWAKEGHEIHLLSSPEALEICKIFKFRPILHALPGPEECTRLTFIWRAIQSMVILPRTLKSFKEGLIYSVNDSVFDSVPAWRLKLSLRDKVRWAAVVHWLPPFPPWKRKKSTLFNSVMFFLNERLSIFLVRRFADVVLAVSDSTSQQLKDYGLDMRKVRSVKCGVNYAQVRRIVTHIKTKAYDAIFMKRAQAVKGIYDFIDIWRRVVDVYPKAKLLIVGGEGDDERELKVAVEKEGLTKNMKFTGYIHSFEEKFTYMAQSKIFVLPSYEENWAIVIGEAMAAGIPVVAYDLKELLQVWGNHVSWVKIGKTEEMAGKILEILDRPINFMPNIRAALKYVKTLDWKEIAQNELFYIKER